MKALPEWPSALSMAALLLGLAALLATGTSTDSGVHRSTQICHVTAQGTCR